MPGALAHLKGSNHDGFTVCEQLLHASKQLSSTPVRVLIHAACLLLLLYPIAAQPKGLKLIELHYHKSICAIAVQKQRSGVLACCKTILQI
jgi:hypothetical protein